MIIGIMVAVIIMLTLWMRAPLKDNHKSEFKAPRLKVNPSAVSPAIKKALTVAKRLAESSTALH
jgi:hypothetical protein